ncbi:acyltransferase family protein [Nocardioides zeae]|uniref:Peptidoglycan/LPS O-acetylase OafA/YrhL n=1 Tax=Nocardioides zeae TaxID=1457234 RepID=A0AAJ1TVN7_9ACTN|nr:acyltransferase family protein [Nocardioides zeae]MDQ1103105.1 peptidoglycan/LPS O-acetylase OafA/YrhL [Nocardioides zeae]
MATTSGGGRRGAHRAPAPLKPGAAAPAPGDLRPDIQGLRTVAVGSVLLYHLWPNRLTGGFVGVDVFFVISGFLIGSHLLKELESSGRIRLGRFWARRAKRLLPASLLVLLVVTVAAHVVMPLSERADVLKEVVGSAFYVQNWVLANEAVDYLAAGDAPSPIQHYWTLSTEEQFYILLPLILAALALLLRRPGGGTRLPRRAVVIPVLAVLAGGSLAYSIHLTTAEPGVAYFSTWTRAWEFLAGVLFAAVAPRLPRWTREVLGWAGAAAVLVTVVTYTGDTAFPGYAAALPVLGTVALLAAADAGPVALASRFRPVTWIGDLSYAIYLWHWPLIVLVPFVTEQPLRTVDKLGIAVVTVLLAWGSTRFIEDPVRFSPRLLGGGRSARAVGAWMLAVTCVVAGSAFGGIRYAEHRQDELIAEANALLASADFRCLGAGQLVNDDECGDFGTVIVPDPSVAGRDDYNDGRCWAPYGESVPQVCRLPLEDDTPEPPADAEPLRVLAVGDSHNNVFLPAYEQMYSELGWQIDVTGRAGCSWSTVPQGNSVGARRDECNEWKRNVADLLADSDPYDLIITTSLQSGFLAEPVDGETQEETTVRGLREAWESQIARGAVVVAIQDNPMMDKDVVQCVEREGLAAVTECAQPPSRAFAGYDAISPAVEQTPGSALVSLRDLQCTDDSCSPVIGNVAVYRDFTHMTATFVRTLTPFFIDRVEAAVAEARASAPANG